MTVVNDGRCGFGLRCRRHRHFSLFPPSSRRRVSRDGMSSFCQSSHGPRLFRLRRCGRGVALGGVVVWVGDAAGNS